MTQYIPGCNCVIVNGEYRSGSMGGCPVHGKRAERPESIPEVDAEMQIEALKGVVTELTGKIQYLVDWADSQGLLEEHLFTFPDGDVFKAKDVEPTT